MTTRYLDDLLHGRLTATPQNEADATYAPLISKADGQLDWHEPAVVVDRRLRAMSPWPGAMSSWQGKGLKILAASPVSLSDPLGAIGEVVPWADSAAVQTADGLLHLRTIQLAGKKATHITDFMRGRPHFLHSILGDPAPK